VTKWRSVMFVVDGFGPSKSAGAGVAAGI